MVYKKEAWINAVKKAIADLKTDKPTSGLPTAVATLRYVRDHALQDMTVVNDASKAHKEAYAEAQADLRESINELIMALSKAKSVDDGFASNASAAAKAAGFKTTSEELAALTE